MTPQTPAEGIMLTKDFGDFKLYKVDCDCGNPDHSVDFIIEYDKDTDLIGLCIYTTATTSWWETVVNWDVDSFWLYSIKSFVNGFFHRVKITKDVWINGFVKYETNVLLTKQSALNLSHAIKTGIGDVDKSVKLK